MLKRIDELVAARATFSFETTLSARSYRASIPEWRRLGYRVAMYFIWLPSAEMAIQRVARRVREGGHNIPESVVRRRYARGLANLFRLYIPVVSKVCIYNGACFPPMPVPVMISPPSKASLRLPCDILWPPARFGRWSLFSRYGNHVALQSRHRVRSCYDT